MKPTIRPPWWWPSSAADIPSHAVSWGRKAPAIDCAIPNAPDPPSAAAAIDRNVRPMAFSRNVLSVDSKNGTRGRRPVNGSVAHPAEDPDDLADVVAVVRPRAAPRGTAAAPRAPPNRPIRPEQQPAIAAVIGSSRLDDPQQLDGSQRADPVAPAEVRGPEVADHPGEDLAPPGRPEHPGVEQDAVADRAADQRLAVVAGEAPAAAGRIDQQARPARRR